MAAAPGVPGGPFGGEAYVFSGVDGAIIHTLKPVDPESAETFVGLSFAGTDVGHVYVVAGQPTRDRGH